MNLTNKFHWGDARDVGSRHYTCGYCNWPLASEKGWHANIDRVGSAYIYICHHCSRPTYFDPEGDQVPGVIFGNSVNDITDTSVQSLYEEARRCTGTGASTAAVLCCRKILMHIAVSKGADPGKSFADYVDFLSQKNFIPPDAKSWVDHIRLKANEANHEINLMKPDDAKELLQFIEMLLKIIFEFPATVRRKYPSARHDP